MKMLTLGILFTTMIFIAILAEITGVALVKEYDKINICFRSAGFEILILP